MRSYNVSHFANKTVAAPTRHTTATTADVAVDAVDDFQLEVSFAEEPAHASSLILVSRMREWRAKAVYQPKLQPQE
ncbi:uncharacterized protein ATC70_004128 [Mucor velutinosus]|uniref:Uncharacterized protein n=1 Tax=Mucor velutinosus TaxID=708070 RepID=A0AAN7HQR0_9FUNG|nr:hypothetical protein ATC70_004128 [Mucor velutinosus]